MLPTTRDWKGAEAIAIDNTTSTLKYLHLPSSTSPRCGLCVGGEATAGIELHTSEQFAPAVVYAKGVPRFASLMYAFSKSRKKAAWSDAYSLTHLPPYATWVHPHRASELSFRALAAPRARAAVTMQSVA